MTPSAGDERLRRWRLVLGAAAEDGTQPLRGADQRMDAALAAVYEAGGQAEGGAPGRAGRHGGLGASAPRVARWLGDVRAYFPSTVVRVVQRDALERLGIEQMLLEPELLEAVEPDGHLVGTLLSLSRVMPERAKETARLVVRKVVEELDRRLAQRTRQAVTGALDRAVRGRPRSLREVDWNRTIHANLRHYQPDHRTVVPERLIGHARRRRAFERELILAVDQSGSMASSVVHAGVLGAALAGVRSLRTSLVAFDTAVVDLTPLLHDPVEVLFGTQLGGGTDIGQALAYCQGLVTRPNDTILVLVSDLYEGGPRARLLDRVGELVRAGVQVIALLALADDGTPAYDHDTAAAFSGFGVPCFACTPDRFPELMAAAIDRRDLTRWAADQGLGTSRGG
jgi:Mg-chelatase subunit ChlD